MKSQSEPSQRPQDTEYPEYPEYYDISPLLCDQTAVFPGDQPFRREIALDFKRGDHFLLSSLQMSAHLGAHADAPNHYHRLGEGIGARSLRYYLGACQVISVDLRRGQRILPDHIRGIPIRAPRVLFKTGSFPDPMKWNGDFNSLSPELIEELASKRVILVGLDTPSVDPAESKALESHQSIFRHDLAVLEGVVLEGVPDGIYTLVALPLKLEDADASPVRAILLKQGAEP